MRTALRTALTLVTIASTSLAGPASADPPSERCDDGRAVCLVRKYWHGDDGAALAVVDCESEFDEDAQRPGSQYIGLFQIGTQTHADRIARVGREGTDGVEGTADDGEPYTTDDMRDGGKNTAVAFDLFEDKGWQPWEQCR